MGAERSSDSSRLSPEELAAWRGLLRVHAAITRELDAELESRHGIGLTSYEVLITIADAGGELRMSELADRVIISRSGLTRLVDRLVRGGALLRKPCEDDKRGSYAVLTEQGSELLAAMRPGHREDVRARFLRHFDRDELRTLGAFWERVLPGAAELPASREKT